MIRTSTILSEMTNKINKRKNKLETLRLKIEEDFSRVEKLWIIIKRFLNLAIIESDAVFEYLGFQFFQSWNIGK